LMQSCVMGLTLGLSTDAPQLVWQLM
jgi:hypothetical protein